MGDYLKARCSTHCSGNPHSESPFEWERIGEYVAANRAVTGNIGRAGRWSLAA
jgi:hypothetical protein